MDAISAHDSPDDLHRLALAGRLAAGVAHDFGNLLQVIVAGLRLLKNRSGTREQAVIEEMTEAARLGGVLLEQLRGVARGGTAVACPWDVCQLAGTTSRLLNRLVAPAVLRYQIPDEPISVTADIADLLSIVLNLVLNARDAGASSIVVFVARVSRPGEKDRLLLSVSDDGAGMDEATRARIFEPFFTRRGSAGGTGLGLYNVHRLVRGYDGRITVDSKVGEGSRVILELPVVA
jgi:signal transduction histidine kinase